MALRVRLNVLVSGIFVALIVLGTFLAVHNARVAIRDEAVSAVGLTVQFVDFAIGSEGAEGVSAGSDDLIRRVQSLEAARHVRILIESDSGVPVHSAISDAIEAPDWFVRWVRPEAIEFRREIGDSAILISADPADEIEEAWVDARNLLGLVVLFSIIANGIFFLLVGRWLRPLGTIGSAMDEVQRGNYRQRLPSFDLPELSGISTHFNRMTETLESSREENRLLTQKTLAIQENERRALAHELHDELGQSISAIKAVAVSIGRGDSKGEDIASATSTIAEVSSHIYSVVRGMMTRLRPVLLDEFGLVPALQDLVDSWNSRSDDAFCRFDASGNFDELDDDQKIGIYRIVQEALTNITKHAQATNIDVSLARECTGQGERVSLSIMDNGVGFDVSASPAGLGLIGMRERVDALGGVIDINSSRQDGTRLMVLVPLDRIVLTP